MRGIIIIGAWLACALDAPQGLKSKAALTITNLASSLPIVWLLQDMTWALLAVMGERRQDYSSNYWIRSRYFRIKLCGDILCFPLLFY